MGDPVLNDAATRKRRKRRLHPDQRQLGDLRRHVRSKPAIPAAATLAVTLAATLAATLLVTSATRAATNPWSVSTDPAWYVTTELLVSAIVLIAMAPMIVWMMQALLGLIAQRQATVAQRLATANANTPAAPDTPFAPSTRPRPTRCRIVIPAHDEADHILHTLDSLRSALPARRDEHHIVSPPHPTADRWHSAIHARILVVAHNCRDDTAQLARAWGAEVLTHNAADQVGKVYALNAAIDHLRNQPEPEQPDVIVVIDADCQVEPGAIEALARQVVDTGRPAQAMYALRCGPETTGLAAVSAMSCLFKNIVRPLGLSRLGLPVPLMGSGDAFPWPVIRDLPMDTRNTAEDYQLTIDLALRGITPLLCPHARLNSLIAQEGAGMTTQRRRWEHGHLYTTFTQVPRLLQAALRQRRLDLLALALDFAVPPMSVVVFIGLAAMALATAAWLLWGLLLPLTLVLWISGLTAGVILGGLLRFGPGHVPFRALGAVPGFLLFKIPIYLDFLVNRETRWVRTIRAAEAKPERPAVSS